MPARLRLATLAQGTSLAQVGWHAGPGVGDPLMSERSGNGNAALEEREITVHRHLVGRRLLKIAAGLERPVCLLTVVVRSVLGRVESRKEADTCNQLPLPKKPDFYDERSCDIFSGRAGKEYHPKK